MYSQVFIARVYVCLYIIHACTFFGQVYYECIPKYLLLVFMSVCIPYMLPRSLGRYNTCVLSCIVCMFFVLHVWYAAAFLWPEGYIINVFLCIVCMYVCIIHRCVHTYMCTCCFVFSYSLLVCMSVSYVCRKVCMNIHQSEFKRIPKHTLSYKATLERIPEVWHTCVRRAHANAYRHTHTHTYKMSVHHRDACTRLALLFCTSLSLILYPHTHTHTHTLSLSHSLSTRTHTRACSLSLSHYHAHSHTRTDRSSNKRASLGS